MIDQHKLTLFKELFNQAQTVLVIYAPDALRDHLFAATALYKTFQQLGNKEVTLLSSEDLSTVEPDIVYLNETKTDVGHKNLCISFDYSPESVEKITSVVDEDAKKLHLTIKPKKGIVPLSKDNITFSYTGAEADMVILVGVDDLESLEQLYVGYENLYQNTSLISINSYETSFGNLKLDILGSACVSEYVAALLRDLNYQIDFEVATNLLAGIDEETDNLESYLATADTFEVVSYLLRSGARRFVRVAQNQNDETQTESTIISEGEQELFGNLAETQDNPLPSNSQDYDDKVFVISEPVKNELEQQNQLPKKGRGRPKGSRNKATIAQTANEQVSTKNKNETKDASKPGDLKFNPSGFGPSTT